MKNIIAFVLAFFMVTQTYAQTCVATVYDGSDDYIEVPNLGLAASVPQGADFTIEAWIQMPNAAVGPNDSRTIMANMAFGTSSPTGLVGFNFHVTQDPTNGFATLAMDLAGEYYAVPTSTTSTPNLADGECHHVVVQRSGDLLNFYIDGFLVYSIGHNPWGLASSQPAWIGQNPLIPGPSSTFLGLIDDVRFWTIAVPASNIMTNMNSGTAIIGSFGLEAYWPLNDNAPSQTAVDVTGNGYDGVLGGSTIISTEDPTWIDECCNGDTPPPADDCVSLYFDGADDYVTVSSAFAGSAAPASSDFTIEAWIQISPNDDPTRLVSIVSNTAMGPTGAGQQGFDFFLYIDGTGGFTHRVLAIETEFDGVFIADATSPVLDDGECHHVVAQRAGDFINLFVDGINVGTFAHNPASLGSPNPMTIGNNLYYSGNHTFLGLIDEVRFWSVARTQAEIMANMNVPLTGTEAGLSAYWPMDEGNPAQITIDATANGWNGTLGSTLGVDANDPFWYDDCCQGDTPPPTECPYVIQSDTLDCYEDGQTFCIWLNTQDIIDNNITGMDYCLNYNPSIMTPTGNFTLGNVVTNTGNYPQGTDSDATIFVDGVNSRVHASIFYLPSAPAGVSFSNIIDGVICLEFTLNAGVTPNSATSLSDCEVRESFATGVEDECADDGTLFIGESGNADGQIIYWNDSTRPITQNSTISTMTVQRSEFCDPIAGSNMDLDALGCFEYNTPGPNSGVYINRDIINAFAPTTPALSGLDCAFLASITTFQPLLPNGTTPNAYQMIAGDVNVDDLLSAGEVTSIQQRIVGLIDEFPQAAYPVGQSLDWRFVDQITAATEADYSIHGMYPNFGDLDPTDAGYWRDDVPNVPECLPVCKDTIIITPVIIGTGTATGNPTSGTAGVGTVGVDPATGLLSYFPNTAATADYEDLVSLFDNAGNLVAEVVVVAGIDPCGVDNDCWSVTPSGICVATCLASAQNDGNTLFIYVDLVNPGPVPIDLVYNVLEIDCCEDKFQYHSVLLGDLTGNWTDGPSALRTLASGTTIFDLNQAISVGDDTFEAPISIQADGTVYGYDFFMDYDETAIEILSVSNTATADSEGYNMVYNATNGSLKITAYNVAGGSEYADLFTVTFRSISGGPVSTSSAGVSITAYINEQNSEVYSSGITGIGDNINEGASLNIYPNPAKDVINIQFTAMDNNSNYNLRLYSVHGQLVKEQMINGSQQAMNVEQLSPGIYLMSVFNNNELITNQKVVIH